ncbi:uncharacterized protein LOC112553997 isoform X2 [Pomacea canaliculata]|uniref:uncharacterized protein LOC112553997 isoform X2 n=1 Tax=Pomacea canaliculata TaxID=400727 RepID=UPI000D73507E|nr:uncharacterized protein LOC112553997 isoform X2 [Pomacea canaliculata]
MAAKPRDPQGPSPWAAPHSRWARALSTRDSSAWVALTRVGCVRGICERLRCHLSSLWLEVIVVTLTLLSSLAITGELLVRFDILKVPSESCLDNQSLRSSDSESGARDVTTAETTSVSPGGAHGAHTMDIVRKVFHYISLAIAAVFLAEILLKMAAFRLKFFLNHWQVLDMLIVFATMVVEVAFDVEQTTPELEAATYIVIFRLWRLPHTCNIKAKAVQRSLEQEIEVWKAGKIKLDDKCNNLEMKNNKQKEKTDRLESELASLKAEMKAKHVSAHSNTTGAAPSSNAHIPLDMVDGLSSGRLVARHSLLPEDTFTHAQSQNKNKFSDREKLRAEEDDGKHNDRHEEDEDRGDRRKGRYFRSGSESSLSCHAMEHEVHVQIEDRPEVRTESSGYTSSPESTRRFPLQTTPERGRGQPHDRAALVTGEQHERDVAYDNEGYRWDEADGDVEITGVLVHEIDGVKTYRSAEGIPMTSL